MAVIESRRGLQTGTLALLVANLLPIGGLVAFGWQPHQALFVYWVELGVTLLGYFTIVLFAQRTTESDSGEPGWLPGPVALPVPDGEANLTASLPSVRYQNLRFVPAAIPLVGICWFLTSRAFLDFPNTAVAVRRSLTASDPYIVLSYTPEGLGLAAVTSVIQLGILGRDFLRRRLVDHYSVAMLVELPVRIAVGWFAVTLLLVPLYAGTVLFDLSAIDWVFLVLLVGVKVVIDRALLRLRYEEESGRLAGLFRPVARTTS